MPDMQNNVDDNKTGVAQKKKDLETYNYLKEESGRVYRRSTEESSCEDWLDYMRR